MPSWCVCKGDLMASIILFADKNFGGASQRFDGPTASLGGLSKVASALIVCDGAWKLYSEPNYQGTVWTVCSTGGPSQNGLYPLYDPQFFANDTVQSLQPVTYQDAGIILFQHSSFGGESIRLFEATADLTELASFSPQSAIVCDGSWMLCAATNYQGEGQSVQAASVNSSTITGLYPQLVFSPKSVRSQAPSPAWSAVYGAIFGQRGAYRAMGYSWAAQEVGGGITGDAYGLARSAVDSPPDGLPFTADTRMCIASVSKEVTAAAILTLINDGVIHAIDDPMLPYIEAAIAPYLNGQQLPAGVSSITIRDLLTMCSGLHVDDALKPNPGQNIWGYLADHLLLGIQQGSIIGVTDNYSNADFTTLQGIITSCSGMDYVEYVTSNVLEPLGVDTTIFNPEPDPANIRTLAYAGPNDTNPGHSFGRIDFVAPGGWVTSVKQLVVFLSGIRRMLSSSGMFDDLLGFYVENGTYGQYFHHNGGLVNGPQKLSTGGVHFSWGWDAGFFINSPDNYSQGGPVISAMITAFENAPMGPPPAVKSSAPQISP